MGIALSYISGKNSEVEMRNYLIGGLIAVVMVVLFGLNIFQFVNLGNQSVTAANPVPGAPAAGEIYVGAVAGTPTPVVGGCCPFTSGTTPSSGAGAPSCH
jgi:hypothetical protein